MKNGDTHVSGVSDNVRIFIHVHDGTLKMNFCKRIIGNPNDEWEKKGETFKSKALPWSNVKGQVSQWLSSFGSDFGNLLDAIGQEYSRFA